MFPGDFRGSIVGVVIANDQFELPAQLGENRRRVANRRKGLPDQLLFVERRNDNGNLHAK